MVFKIALFLLIHSSLMCLAIYISYEKRGRFLTRCLLIYRHLLAALYNYYDVQGLPCSEIAQEYGVRYSSGVLGVNQLFARGRKPTKFKTLCLCLDGLLFEKFLAEGVIGVSLLRPSRIKSVYSASSVSVFLPGGIL